MFAKLPSERNARLRYVVFTKKTASSRSLESIDKALLEEKLDSYFVAGARRVVKEVALARDGELYEIGAYSQDMREHWMKKILPELGARTESGEWDAPRTHNPAPPPPPHPAPPLEPSTSTATTDGSGGGRCLGTPVCSPLPPQVEFRQTVSHAPAPAPAPARPPPARPPARRPPPSPLARARPPSPHRTRRRARPRSRR